MVPDPSLSIRQRAVASWPLAWQGQNQRDILVTLGYDVDIPWSQLPKNSATGFSSPKKPPRCRSTPG